MKERPGRTPRFYVEASLREGASIELAAPAAHHALRVLRLREGHAVTLFDGKGGEWPGALKSGSRVQIGAWRNVERESPLRLTLAQGVSTGERMDLTVQKAVELGVAVIQPLLTEKGVVRLQGARLAARVEHWRRIAASACEQCGRNRIPEVRPASDVDGYCRSLRDAEPRILLSPEGAKRLRELEIGAAVTLAAGPEAGFSEEEEAALERAGFTRVRLGPRVLRTETAALAAIAALNALRGDF